jgi:hypothetical protein
MVRYKYVILYGPNGVTRELSSPKTAMKLAQKYKNRNPRKTVEVDRISIYSKNHYSQGLYKKIKKRR